MTDQAHLSGYSAIKTIALMWWLVCLTAAKIYYGVDMGSQYMKIGMYDSVTNEITNVELDGSDLIPSALALKVKASKEEHITPSDFPNSQILLGSQAVKAIHKDPKVGVEFLPLAAGRVDDEYLTSKFLNGLEFLALFEYELFRKVPTPDGIAVCLPFILTPMQKARLMNTYRFGALPVTSMNEDISAVSELYVSKFPDNLKEGVPRIVMFIDAGAGYFRCYVQNLTRADGNVTSRTLAIDWSEKASGIAMARALAERTRLPLQEAQKMLGDFGVKDADFANETLEEMSRVIKSVLEKSEPVHEFQIFGGCSKYEYVRAAVDAAIAANYRPDVDAILKGGLVVNQTAQRDFDPDRAVIDGVMAGIRNSFREDGFEHTHVLAVFKPAWTFFFNYGTQKEMYCQQGFNCRNPRLTREKGVRFLNITLDPKTVPKGSPIVANQYRILNLSRIEYDEKSPGYLFFHLEFPYPSIRGIGFNKQGGNWTEISFEQVMYNEREYSDSFEAFKELLRTTATEDEEKFEQVKLVQSLIAKIGEFTQNISEEKVDDEFREILEKLESIESSIEDGSFQKLPLDKIKATAQEIQDLVPTISAKLF